MLEIIIVFSIYLGLQKLFLDYPIGKRIRNAKTAEEAIKHRKRLKRFRLIFFITFIVAYILYVFISFLKNNANTLDYTIRGIGFVLVALYQFLFTGRESKKYMGNISTYAKSDYLERYNHFALFLRGFEKDNYSKEEDLYKDNNLQGFSEYKFMSALQSRIPTCAIGMTKETDAPYGAQRIYVNDNSWKQDVKELMEKADEIYILVNDRDSCIWEIEQSADLLDKTTFIIDEPNKYENVRNALLKSNMFFLPALPSGTEPSHHLLLRIIKEGSIFEQFENTPDNYLSIINANHTKEKKNRKKNNNSKKDIKKIGIVSGILVIMFVIFFWSVGVDNRLSNSASYVMQTWMQVEFDYVHRADIFQELVVMMQNSDYHDNLSFSEITNALNNVDNAIVFKIISSEVSLRAYQDAQIELSRAVANSINVLEERNPELTATQWFNDLQTQIENANYRISIDQNNYNLAVYQYNSLRNKFPHRIIACILGFHEYPTAILE